MRPSESKHRKRLFRALVGILVISIALFVVAVIAAPDSDSLLYEGAKTLPQIGLVLVAGAVVSSLTFDYQQDAHRSEKELDEIRSQHEVETALLRDTLKTVGDAYLDLKSSRRMMRARGLHTDAGVALAVTAEYDLHMERINSVQLRLEQLAQDVDSSKESYSDSASWIAALSVMEETLHQLISEYEIERPRIGAMKSVPLGELPRFKAFLDYATPARRENVPTGFAPVHSNLRKLRSLARTDLAKRATQGSAE